MIQHTKQSKPCGIDLRNPRVHECYAWSDKMKTLMNNSKNNDRITHMETHITTYMIVDSTQRFHHIWNVKY